MDKIEFTKPERAALADAIRRYFAEELDQEIGGLQAELFLDFIGETIGPVFYNRGLFDAEAAMMKKMDDLSDAIRMLERPLPAKR